MFLVMYPLGVGAELLCMWDAKRFVTTMPMDSRPWTMVMPNSLNIEFRFEWAVYLQYFLYSFGFPMLYNYMLT